MDTITLVEGDGLMHPRGPLPPGTYWRRRVIVLGGVLLAMVLLVTQCAKGNGKASSSKAKSSGGPSAQSGKSTAKAPTKSASSSGSPTKPASSPPPSSKPAPSQVTSSSPAPSTPSSPAATAPVPCQSPALQISIKANGATFAAGVSPVFTMTIKNAGTTPCLRDVSSAATELQVTSGPDRIWSSDDCAQPSTAKISTLKPNEIKTVAVTWNRKRSKSGASCVGTEALPGQYRVVGRLGNDRTAAAKFALL